MSNINEISSYFQRLEAYTRKRSEEVILVSLGQTPTDLEDEIIIFKGFSSSLMRPTDFNPDNPVVNEPTEILRIDRLRGPYNPSQPVFIEQGLSIETMEQHLKAAGIR